MDDDKDKTKKQQVRAHHNPTLPSPLAMHRSSRAISKPRPRIRIIHIFAPEIIKTDVENFRELVQRLTGKPPEEEHRRLTMTNHLRASHVHNRPKVLGGFSRYYGEVELEEEEEEEGREESPLLAIDVSHVHAFEAAQLA